MTRTGLALLLCLSTSLALAQRAHVHGQGSVQVALENGQLHILMTIPAMDVVGFEHAPSNERQQDAVHIAAARLADVAQVIRLPQAAGCRVEMAEVKSALLEAAANAGGHRHRHHHHHDHHHKPGEEHAEFDGQYQFRCASPDALTQLSFTLFDWLPALTLRAELVTAGGASAATLTQQQPALVMPGR
jgi:hypothetical protein